MTGKVGSSTSDKVDTTSGKVGVTGGTVSGKVPAAARHSSGRREDVGVGGGALAGGSFGGLSRLLRNRRQVSYR